MMKLETRNSKPSGGETRHRSVAGFTLLEVLVAMGIFAIGFVAVASLFPLAAVMQRDTMDDVLVDQVAANVTAALQGRRFRQSDLDNWQPHGSGPKDPATFQVHPLNPQLYCPYDLTDTKLLTPFPRAWPLRDRSYPAITADPSLRRFFWVPLARRTASPTSVSNWQVFVFILRRDDGRTYLADAAGSAAYRRSAAWNLDGAAFTFVSGQVPAPIDSPSSAKGELTDDNGLAGAANPKEHNDIPHVVCMPVSVDANDKSHFIFTPLNNTGNDLWVNDRVDSSASPPYIFRPTAAYPPVANQVQIGDPILDNNGNTYTVARADATGCWVAGEISTQPDTGALPTKVYYGQPGCPTRVSPTCRILVLSDVVEP